MATTETDAPPAPRRRRRFRLPSPRTALVVTHRWSSLILGIALLAVVISGVVLLYEQEIDRVVHPGLHKVTESDDPLTHSEAAAVVRREAPDFKPTDVVDSHGVYLLYGESEFHQAYVDPGTGKLNGIDDISDGVVGFLYNLHLCGLSCKGYAGYIPFLEKPAHILGNEELTVGGLILAITGLLLILLAATGHRRVVAGHQALRARAAGSPPPGRLRLQLRHPQHHRPRRDPVPRHVGLHRRALRAQADQRAVVRGAAGSGAEERTVESKPIEGRSVTMDQAAAIARKTVPDARLVSVSVPDKEKKSTYFAYLAQGNDPYDHGIYPGNVGVTIDRYSGKATVTYPTQVDPPLSAQIVDDWFYSFHAATFVNGWWRILWVVLGVTPVLLAATGVTRGWSAAASGGARRRGPRRPPRHERVARRHGRAVRRRGSHCSRSSPPRVGAAWAACTPPPPSCSAPARRSTP